MSTLRDGERDGERCPQHDLLLIFGECDVCAAETEAVMNRRLRGRRERGTTRDDGDTTTVFERNAYAARLTLLHDEQAILARLPLRFATMAAIDTVSAASLICKGFAREELIDGETWIVRGRRQEARDGVE